MQDKERLDKVLINNGIFDSRERARENIILGNILVDGVKVTKCGKKISQNAKIDFIGEKLKYVSRGGLKLDRAIDTFNIQLNDCVCMDVGASTGGFTDCMLQNGAKKVYAVDVGTSQLHSKIRLDDRVISMENTNARYLSLEQIGELCDFISIDVSFISLTKLLDNISSFLNDSGKIVALIKPQFEAGKSFLNKKGVVKDSKIHIEVINNIIKYCQSINLSILNLDYSPVKGPNGNVEYLIYLAKEQNQGYNFTFSEIVNTVQNAYINLK